MADNSLRDRFMQNGDGVAMYATAPMVNAPLGGQNGVMPDISKYLMNSAYVKRQLIVRVITFPGWVDSMPNPDAYRRAIKSFWEVQAKIEGLNKALTAEFVEQDLGSTGKKQYDVSRVVEAQSDITTSLVDKYGQPFKELFTLWLRFGMMDPESGVPLISVIDNDVTDLLPDKYCCTVMFFEPDPLLKSVQNAWLITNMAPRGNGPDEGRRDLTASGDVSELSFGWTSLQQTGYGVKKFAQKLLDELNREGLNPITREPFVDEVDADVTATKVGYFDQAEIIAGQQMKSTI